MFLHIWSLSPLIFPFPLPALSWSQFPIMRGKPLLYSGLLVWSGFFFFFFFFLVVLGMEPRVHEKQVHLTMSHIPRPWFCDTGSHCAARAGLEVVILLPLLLEWVLGLQACTTIPGTPAFHFCTLIWILSYVEFLLCCLLHYFQDPPHPQISKCIFFNSRPYPC
jgi:hypothetical protein